MTDSTEGTREGGVGGGGGAVAHFDLSTVHRGSQVDGDRLRGAVGEGCSTILETTLCAEWAGEKRACRVRNKLERPHRTGDVRP